ncbi:MAG: hypothetical protein RL571_921 [Pseudomonadota bacterium]|jgi:hypothetical protein
MSFKQKCFAHITRKLLVQEVLAIPNKMIKSNHDSAPRLSSFFHAFSAFRGKKHQEHPKH